MSLRRTDVPNELLASHLTYFGEAGQVWIDALPELAADCMDRWRLRRDGPPTFGAVALVLPVLRADGSSAILKLQPVDDETVGEPAALRLWNGDGAVRLLEHDPESGSMLLERLDPSRSLASVPDDLSALEILSGILARLTAVAAPVEMRRLDHIARHILARIERLLSKVPDASERRLLQACAAIVHELLPEPGDRLLHWDLHFDNVLAPLPDADREPWLAIDPKPLAGDPAFDLLPALHNRWEDLAATGDVPRALRRRFDLMTDVLGLDRERAVGWTLARVLQNVVWDLENDARTAHSVRDTCIARTLIAS